MVEQAKVRGENYYRIMVGPEMKRTLAERMLEQIAREEIVSGKPFIRKVS